MKEEKDILVVGLGVIGTIYGYIFNKAGHSVEHYIRKSSKRYTLDKLTIDMLDGRTNSKGIQYQDTYKINKASKKIYDYIFVSIPSGNIKSAIEELNKENITGTIILGCGFWGTHEEIDKIMNGREYILGYPVAGGGLEGEVLTGCIFDHFMLEDEKNATISNYEVLKSLFDSSNLKLECPYDMLEWIWLHMAINAGVVSVAGKYGDINDVSSSAEGLMNSSKKLAEAIKSIRETSKIIESRGVQLNHYNNELLAYKLPTVISSPLMKMMFSHNVLTRKIMTLHSNLADLIFVCKCVYDEGKQNHVEAPLFYSNYENVLSKIHI